MLYKKIQPPPELKPFIECFFIWECYALKESIAVESPPNGFNAMVFNYGEPYLIQNEKYQEVKVPEAFLSGQATSSYRLQLHNRVSMAGIVFKPTALHTLFNLPVFEFTDDRIDLTDVLGNQIHEITARLAEADTHEKKIEILTKKVVHWIYRSKPKSDFVDQAVQIIQERKGNIRMNELSDKMPVCNRQFERKFLYKIGISPKCYAQIYRTGQICLQITHHKITHWQDFIYNHGYYDQSHFIKEFTKFTGRNPTYYAQNNKELINFLSQKI
jgi:AraC-like DNA-binding protein